VKRGVPASPVRGLGANVLKARAFRRGEQERGASLQKRPPKRCCLNSRAKLHKCQNALTSRKS
jgi:hypothetical protein